MRRFICAKLTTNIKIQTLLVCPLKDRTVLSGSLAVQSMKMGKFLARELIVFKIYDQID